MKVAVIGSRNLTIENFEKYLPPDTTEIVSGGAKGIDACARTYACKCGLSITEFLPEYEKYGKTPRSSAICKSSPMLTAFSRFGMALRTVRNSL